MDMNFCDVGCRPAAERTVPGHTGGGSVHTVTDWEDLRPSPIGCNLLLVNRARLIGKSHGELLEDPILLM